MTERGVELSDERVRKIADGTVHGDSDDAQKLAWKLLAIRALLDDAEKAVRKALLDVAGMKTVADLIAELLLELRNR